MSTSDILVGIAFGLSAGSIFGFYWSKYRIKSSAKNAAPVELKSKPPTIQSEQARNSKQEAKMLLLEKDFLSNAITRVFELEAQGQITKDERDAIVKKYKDRLMEVDKKLDSIELIIEVSELENLRNELVFLLTRKIEDVDRKLEKALARLDMQKLKAPSLQGEEKIPTLSQPNPQKIEKKSPRPLESSIDRELKQYREEIMKALEKLEQIDLEEA